MAYEKSIWGLEGVHLGKAAATKTVQCRSYLQQQLSLFEGCTVLPGESERVHH